MLCSTLDTLEKCTRHSLVSARLDTFNQLKDTTSDSQSVKQQSLTHTYTHLHPPTFFCCCCCGLIRKSLPFSLCSNSANSSVTKLKSAHKIGTTVVFGAPAVQISITIRHTIAHVLVLFSSFYCCVASVFCMFFFFGFFAFRYEHEKKSYSHDAVAIRSVNRIEVSPQPQPDNQMS